MVGNPFEGNKPNNGAFGDVEANVRADLSALLTSHPFGETLGAVARRLARELDEGRNDLKAPVAGTARELRQTVAELARLGVDGDDGFEGDIGRPTMPPTVRDSPES